VEFSQACKQTVPYPMAIGLRGVFRVCVGAGVGVGVGVWM
jgi:hypothetical protein